MNLKRCCDLLEQQQLKLAFIESASSGYLTSQFSIYKNSGADILLGGLVTYDPSIKVSVLGLDSVLIQQFTAESMQVTRAMAKHGKRLFKEADLIIACTGLLKPGGSETPEKPEGTFFISIFYQENLYCFHYIIEGTALERLNRLTDYVAEEIIKLIN